MPERFRKPELLAMRSNLDFARPLILGSLAQLPMMWLAEAEADPGSCDMSTVKDDFNRIALVSPEGATHNEHYHKFLLRYAPKQFQTALDIGCGTGSFARRLAAHAEHVLALDLSPEMIRLARERSARFSNIDFQLADVRVWEPMPEKFDCVASIATLHHLPFGEMLLKMKSSLKPGGVLLILDLFEPQGLSDMLWNLVAIPVSVGLRLIHHRRLLPQREVRAAWSAHERHDTYPTMKEVRALCAEILPNAKITQHLLWRYSIVWTKER